MDLVSLSLKTISSSLLTQQYDHQDSLLPSLKAIIYSNPTAKAMELCLDILLRQDMEELSQDKRLIQILIQFLTRFWTEKGILGAKRKILFLFCHIHRQENLQCDQLKEEVTLNNQVLLDLLKFPVDVIKNSDTRRAYRSAYFQMIIMILERSTREDRLFQTVFCDGIEFGRDWIRTISTGLKQTYYQYSSKQLSKDIFHEIVINTSTVLHRCCDFDELTSIISGDEELALILIYLVKIFSKDYFLRSRIRKLCAKMFQITPPADWLWNAYITLCGLSPTAGML